MANKRQSEEDCPRRQVSIPASFELLSVLIPSSRLRCVTCHKWKNLQAYSEAQKVKYQTIKYKKHNRIICNHREAPKCTECNNSVRSEMTCFYCEETKGLEEFSGNARRHGDRAVKPSTIAPIEQLG